MPSAKKSLNQTHRDIAKVLGGPMRRVVVPLIAAAGIVRLTIEMFVENQSLLLIWTAGVGAAILLAALISYLLAPVAGKLILRDIGKDYGAKTRQYVFDKFAMAQDGDKIELDIPAIARTYRED